ncbi:MAG: hypothetical protein R6U67_10835 [Sodalinema sp.]|uniref:hypothetical protein n=1 Tax=Sodalinema sp. TaxID=3080550 RepID=UPI00396F6784
MSCLAAMTAHSPERFADLLVSRCAPRLRSSGTDNSAYRILGLTFIIISRLEDLCRALMVRLTLTENRG